MARNKKQRQSVGLRKTPRKPTCHTPRVTKPRLVMIDLSGRKQLRKGKHAKNDLIRRQIIQERKRQTTTSGSNNNNKAKNSPSRRFILYPPVPPPPPPTGRATSSSSNRKPQPKKYDTIVIDSEDESCSTDRAADAIPSFYEDRIGGFDQKEVPQYISHCDDVQLVDESLEEGEIREEDLNGGIVNDEAIPIDGDEDEPDVVKVDDSELTVPLPKCEDQSVIFCSEVIDLSREVDRNKLLDFIPIGYDTDPVDCGARQRSPRKKNKKVPREDKQQRQTERMDKTVPDKEVPRSTKRMVVIDGNNVAFAHTVGKAFSVKGLEICIQYFKKMGHNVKAVVPQFRLKKEKSTDQKLLEDLYKAGDVLLAPSKNLPGQRSSSYDDRLIISIAEKFDGVIISNDNFRDLLTESDSWKKIIETRVVGYTWVIDAFFLPDDPYGRHGPKLKELLEPVAVAKAK